MLFYGQSFTSSQTVLSIRITRRHLESIGEGAGKDPCFFGRFLGSVEAVGLEFHSENHWPRFLGTTVYNQATMSL